MDAREVFHAILKVPHVAEEVFGELLDGFDDWCRGERWSSCGVLKSGRGLGGHCGRRGRMSCYEGGDEEGKEEHDQW